VGQNFDRLWPALFGSLTIDHANFWPLTNMHEYNRARIQSFLLCIDYAGSNQPISFFLSFLHARVLVNQFLFFSHYFFFTLLIYAQPTLDLNLAWRTYFSWFFDLFFGVRHDLAHFKNDHTKSKVLGHMTAQHLILISTSAKYLLLIWFRLHYFEGNSFLCTWSVCHMHIWRGVL